jgi:hemerythrin-like domain-containing protein
MRRDVEAYLSRPIKDVITEFPEVAKILDEHGVGCAPCNVGTCLLKDIVEIHDLPPEQEQRMMAKIAKVIYPDKVINIPPLKKKKKEKPKGMTYSPPLKALVEEHRLIKRWLALIPEVIMHIDLESEEDRRLVLQGVDFIRSYADRYHHAKEEEILFKYFDQKLDILKVMYEDHAQGRSHAKAIAEAVERRDREVLGDHLKAYRELLAEHIRKEDEILYPWMDRSLSITQIGEIYSKFQETDEKIGYSPAKFETFVSNLEKRFKK